MISFYYLPLSGKSWGPKEPLTDCVPYNGYDWIVADWWQIGSALSIGTNYNSGYTTDRYICICFFFFL